MRWSAWLSGPVLAVSVAGTYIFVARHHELLASLAAVWTFFLLSMIAAMYFGASAEYNQRVERELPEILDVYPPQTDPPIPRWIQRRYFGMAGDSRLGKNPELASLGFTILAWAIAPLWLLVGLLVGASLA
jgi:hypothetical protein